MWHYVNSVKDDSKKRVDEEGEGDCGVLEVVEVVGRDGPVVDIEGLVVRRGDEELHGNVGGGGYDDEGWFQVL